MFAQWGFCQAAGGRPAMGTSSDRLADRDHTYATEQAEAGKHTLLSILFIAISLGPSPVPELFLPMFF